MIESRDVLTFWLSDPDGDSYPESRMKLWFSKSDETDAEIRERFGEAVIAAGRGELDAWTSTPRGRLAVIILIDQFTRNIYRGSGDMYQFDHHALQLAIDANVVTDWTTANGFGNVDPARLANSVEQIKLTYQFTNAPDVAAYFTGAYLPEGGFALK